MIGDFGLFYYILVASLPQPKEALRSRNAYRLKLLRLPLDTILAVVCVLGGPRRDLPTGLPEDVKGYAHAVKVDRGPEITRRLTPDGHVQDTVHDPGGQVLCRTDVEIPRGEGGACTRDLSLSVSGFE